MDSSIPQPPLAVDAFANVSSRAGPVPVTLGSSPVTQTARRRHGEADSQPPKEDKGSTQARSPAQDEARGSLDTLAAAALKPMVEPFVPRNRGHEHDHGHGDDRLISGRQHSPCNSDPDTDLPRLETSRNRNNNLDRGHIAPLSRPPSPIHNSPTGRYHYREQQLSDEDSEEVISTPAYRRRPDVRPLHFPPHEQQPRHNEGYSKDKDRSANGYTNVEADADMDVTTQQDRDQRAPTLYRSPESPHVMPDIVKSSSRATMSISSLLGDSSTPTFPRGAFDEDYSSPAYRTQPSQETERHRAKDARSEDPFEIGNSMGVREQPSGRSNKNDRNDTDPAGQHSHHYTQDRSRPALQLLRSDSILEQKQIMVCEAEATDEQRQHSGPHQHPEAQSSQCGDAVRHHVHHLAHQHHPHQHQFIHMHPHPHMHTVTHPHAVHHHHHPIQHPHTHALSPHHLHQHQHHYHHHKPGSDGAPSVSSAFSYVPRSLGLNLNPRLKVNATQVYISYLIQLDKMQRDQHRMRSSEKQKSLQESTSALIECGGNNPSPFRQPPPQTHSRTAAFSESQSQNTLVDGIGRSQPGEETEEKDQQSGPKDEDTEMSAQDMSVAVVTSRAAAANTRHAGAAQNVPQVHFAHHHQHSHAHTHSAPILPAHIHPAHHHHHHAVVPTKTDRRPSTSSASAGGSKSNSSSTVHRHHSLHHHHPHHHPYHPNHPNHQHHFHHHGHSALNHNHGYNHGHSHGHVHVHHKHSHHKHSHSHGYSHAGAPHGHHSKSPTHTREREQQGHGSQLALPAPPQAKSSPTPTSSVPSNSSSGSSSISSPDSISQHSSPTMVRTERRLISPPGSSDKDQERELDPDQKLSAEFSNEVDPSHSPSRSTLSLSSPSWKRTSQVSTISTNSDHESRSKSRSPFVHSVLKHSQSSSPSLARTQPRGHSPLLLDAASSSPIPSSVDHSMNVD